MSRIAKKPINVPSDVSCHIENEALIAKGSKGTLSVVLHDEVDVTQADNILSFTPCYDKKSSIAMTGTMRSIVSNMIRGVSTGFEKKLLLVGVGYRAQLQDGKLILSLGFSHTIYFIVPLGIEIETPVPTEIVVRGCDKQRVGQVCAEIRAFRPPEPYKGKGVKYADEVILRKEAKKK